MSPELCKLYKLCRFFESRQQVWNTYLEWYGRFPDPGIDYCSQMPPNPVEGGRTAGNRPEKK